MRRWRTERPAPEPGADYTQTGADAVTAVDHRLNMEFLASAPDLSRCPAGDAPEVAFAGRSNAGKSSVLNRLTGSRHTAKVSKTPGRTRLLNFFALDNGARLVDLPGYGYAKASAKSQAQWQVAVNEYLSFREQLAGVVLVTDIRHPGMAYDEQFIDWALASEMPLHVLLNKADKLKRGAQGRALAAYRQRLGKTATAQLFSALRGEGAAELAAVVMAWIADAGDDPEP